jgi:hypothetical protein
MFNSMRSRLLLSLSHLNNYTVNLILASIIINNSEASICSTSLGFDSNIFSVLGMKPKRFFN